MLPKFPTLLNLPKFSSLLSYYSYYSYCSTLPTLPKLSPFFYPSPLFAPLRLIIFTGTIFRTREYKGY